MAPAMLYTACVLGAVGLYLLVRRGTGRADAALKGLGAILGLAGMGALIGGAADAMGAAPGGGRPGILFTIFAILALGCAVRMITHPKPVYSALYFVLVVLASAGLFLMQEAEFLAFALIIVYAGAILITYMFVLMLAQQSPDPEDPHGQSEYDLNPREPLAGAVVGFILLALLTRAVIGGAGGVPGAPTGAERRLAAWERLQQMPGHVEDMIAAVTDLDEPPHAAMTGDLARLDVDPDGMGAMAYHMLGNTAHGVRLSSDALPDNIQGVGLALILDFPVSLELAGVILLMAMLGAVILARRQIELTEDETREAAGMARLGHHDESAPAGGGA